VEAENNYRRRGTNTQTTTDVGGGLNVGWTDPGTWNEYLVNVSTTGSYTFNFRVASGVATGKFDILVDNVVVKTGVTVPNTGGWQTWVDMPITGIVLTAGQRLIKIKYSGTGTNLNYINIVFENTVPPAADFVATPLNTCVGNKIVFTDQTTNKTGAETYAWNFGNGASPATATTPGPHTVTYSTSGFKTPSLTVTNNVGPNTKTKTNYISIAAPPTSCLFSDEYNDNTVKWITPIPGAFTHSESGSIWTVSNSGYGEWETFNYSLNNGTTAMPLDFSCAANKPVLKITAKASSNALLRVTLTDVNGKTIDNISNYNLELTTTYQTFSIDFSGKFRNYYGSSPGILDSSNITSVQFSVNPAYFSFPYRGANGTYNYAFPGTVSIDWMGIGANCNSATLPVELSSFKATNENNVIDLSWTTLQENNNQYFIIEKSTDAINFSEIGKVNGSGNSRSPVQYSFKDFSGLSSINYYRLKQVDANGAVLISEVITISPTIGTEETTITIYPNPSNGDEITIQCTKKNESPIIEVWDIVGKLLFAREMVGSSEVIKSDELKLVKGIYFIRIRNSKEVQKLIVN
jgi:PKD repeat protein